jgi:hypothetical protein
MNRGRLDDAYAGSSSEAARARERMMAAQGQGRRAMSSRTRLITGWAIVLLIAGFFVAIFAGWIDVIPS